MKNPLKQRILVTGGAGFIGSHLCERLLAEQHEVLCVDNFFTGSKRNVAHLLSDPYFELIRHDITFPLYLETDQIFNLACPASPVHYQNDPVQTTKVNVHGAINMLGLAKRLKIRILQASTSEVYGDPAVHPQIESYWGNVNPIGPRACYDEGKRCAETLFFDYHRQMRLQIKVARIFNTYGPRMHPNDGRVVSNFIVQALRGEPITIYGEGSQTRSFCYVDDLVDGLLRLMRSPETHHRADQPGQSHRIHDAGAGRTGHRADKLEVAAGVQAVAGGRPAAPQAGHHRGQRTTGLAAKGGASRRLVEDDPVLRRAAVELIGNEPGSAETRGDIRTRRRPAVTLRWTWRRSARVSDALSRFSRLAGAGSARRRTTTRATSPVRVGGACQGAVLPPRQAGRAGGRADDPVRGLYAFRAAAVLEEAALPDRRRALRDGFRLPRAGAMANGADLERAAHFLRVLEATRCAGYRHAGWGYPFDWVTRNGVMKAQTPLITSTPYVYEAFDAVHRLDGAPRWVQMMQSAAEHAFTEIPDLALSHDAATCAYNPHDTQFHVVNASAYRAFLLFSAARKFARDDYAQAARRNLNYVLRAQQADGSWRYATDGVRDFVDHFHTCFVLKALAKIEAQAADPTVTRAIESGVAYYAKHLFDNDGLPRPFAVAPRLTIYRHELYDYAECINLATLLRGRFPLLDQRLQTTLADLLSRWQKPDGSFRSRRLMLGWDNVPMHRWAQAQLFRSLAFLHSVQQGNTTATRAGGTAQARGEALAVGAA